jgi:hypothetical protein
VRLDHEHFKFYRSWFFSHDLILKVCNFLGDHHALKHKDMPRLRLLRTFPYPTLAGWLKAARSTFSCQAAAAFAFWQIAGDPLPAGKTHVAN